MTYPYGSNNPDDNPQQWNSHPEQPYSQPFDSGTSYPYERGYQQPYGQPYGQPFGQPYGGTAAPIPPEVPQPSINEAQWRPFDIGVVFGQAWKGFAASWQAWVLSMLIYMAIFIVAASAWFIPFIGIIAAAETSSSGAAGPSAAAVGAFGIISVIGIVACIALTFVWTINCYRNAFKVVRGETITIGSFFRTRGIGKPIVVYLLTSIVTGIGMLLFVLPGIAAMVILIFALPAAFQLRDSTIGDCFSGSWRAVQANIGQVILMILITMALSFVGSALVVGMLVTTPLMYLIYAYAFQTTAGGPIMHRN